MFDYVMFVDLPNGEKAFFSWKTDRAQAITCAKAQLDLTPYVTITGFCFKGAVDKAATKELKAYVQAKKG